ncbi:MAG TPA: hypothetical protein VGC91_17260 [Pyrinomonadaceae bacterium]|jgi:hypothetical protein
MITLKETKVKIAAEPQWWKIHFMDFVDDFRYHKDMSAISEPFEIEGSRMEALLASMVEALCDELQQEPPAWLASVPACREPYFVSGLESLKAITLVQSPLRFRIRKIFVLENFLSRV